jgi:activating signal cointegrator complex subunit 2
MKNVLVDEVEDETESEDEKPAEQNKDSLNFCENPETIRQRYEERRRAKFETRHGNSSGGAKNVVGKPKGQGQEKDVLLNRLHKDKNKATRANHNRKQGATFKRNKGMIPS